MYMCVLVTQLCPTLWDPMDCSPPGSSVHGILQARILGWVPCPPPGDLHNPGINPKAPTLQVESFLSEPPGKPKNTGVGSLSLLQQIFPTQELNRGLPDSACNGGDLGSIPGMGRSHGEGKGYPLQYSGLEHSMYHIVHQKPVTSSSKKTSHLTRQAHPSLLASCQLGLYLKL